MNTFGDVIERRTVDRFAPQIGWEPPEWTVAAVCASVPDDEMWFPPKGGSANDAKRICVDCPARPECLAFAMATEDADYLRFGVYGGLTPVERRKLGRAGWEPGDPAPDVVIGLPEEPCPYCGEFKKNVHAHVAYSHPAASVVA